MYGILDKKISTMTPAIFCLMILLAATASVLAPTASASSDLTLGGSCSTSKTGPNPSDPTVAWSDADANPADAAIMAYTSYGAGRAVLTGDTNWFDTTYGTLYDNTQLLNNTFNWLAVSGKDVLWYEPNPYLSYTLAAWYSYVPTTLVPFGFTFTAYTGTIDAAALSGYDILVIPNGGTGISNTPPYKTFTSAEISAIATFVANGHGLFLAAENGGAGNDNLDPVALVFNVNFDNNVVQDTTHNHNSYASWPLITDFAAHPLTSSVSTWSYIAGASLTEVITVEKEIIGGSESPYPEFVPINTEVWWDLRITVRNNLGVTLNNVVLTDGVGADLNLVSFPYVAGERYIFTTTGTGPFTVHWYNTPPDNEYKGDCDVAGHNDDIMWGPANKKPEADVKNKGSATVITWNIGNLAPYDVTTLEFRVKTAQWNTGSVKNPQLKQSYTSTCHHELNSGSTVYYIYDGINVMVKGEPLIVSAYNPTPGVDTDGDGYTDVEEVAEGTDPCDPVSYPILV